MLERLTNAYRALTAKSLGTQQHPSQMLEALLTGGASTASGQRVNERTALSISTVYACVRVISEDVAKLPVTVWRRMEDGGRQEATGHPLHAILRRPNRHMSIKSLMMALTAAYQFRGNGIAIILRDNQGRPTGLWPVNPSVVQIHDSPEGRLFYSVTRRTSIDRAVLAGKPEMIPDYDVLHVRGMTFDGLIGMSALAQLRESMGIAIAGEKLSGKMLKNGATPGGTLNHPGKLTDEVMGRLRSTWNSRHAGAENAGNTPILEEGMEFKPTGMSSVDAQFLEQRKFTIEEIARGFRVPLHMIGMLDRMTNNNVEALTRSYYDQALMPVLEVLEAELARAFNLPRNLFVEFDVRRLLRADFKARQEGHRIMFNGGALSPNEWRMTEGMNPTPGGAVYARPLNTSYVDADGTVQMVTQGAATLKEDDDKEDSEDERDS